jgi:DNA-binding MarR family transcriptional regulator
MRGDVQLGLAVRGLVVATERFRARQARTVFGISPTEMTALGALYAEGPCTVSELGRALAMTPASATELADRLERGGLVVRSPHPTDRRKRLLHPTPAAIQAMDQVFEQLTGLMTGAADAARPTVLAFLAAAATALHAAS